MTDMIPARPTAWPGMDTVEVFNPERLGLGEYSETEGRRWIGFANGGAVFAPVWCSFTQKWAVECVFAFEGGLRASGPTRRAMTNHDTYAAHQGGRPVIITRIAA